MPAGVAKLGRPCTSRKKGAHGGNRPFPPWLIVAAVAAVPRLAVLLVERGDILTAFTEKSDDLAQVFVLYNRHDVLNVGVEIHLGAEQVRALPKAGEGRRVDVVAGCP